MSVAYTRCCGLLTPLFYSFSLALIGVLRDGSIRHCDRVNVQRQVPQHSSELSENDRRHPLMIATSFPSSVLDDTPTSPNSVPVAREHHHADSDGHHTSGWLKKRSTKFYCFSTWKPRYFVIRGHFLFRYSHPNDSQHKGAPIDLTEVTVDVADSATHVIRLSTLSKDWIVAADDDAEMSSWIAGIKRAQQIAVKASLGHTVESPTSQSYNAIGRSAVTQRQRRYERDQEHDAVVNPYAVAATVSIH